jgi:pimeloyl-ACP methyl ester carboxylesterase
MDLVKTSTDLLPDGSELKVIPGGSHIVLYEKDCYKEFQDNVVDFLTGE